MLINRQLAALVFPLLVGLLGSGCAKAPDNQSQNKPQIPDEVDVPPQEKTPQPLTKLPAEVVAAWEKAGAKVGWMGPENQSRILQFTGDRIQLVKLLEGNQVLEVCISYLPP